MKQHDKHKNNVWVGIVIGGEVMLEAIGVIGSHESVGFGSLFSDMWPWTNF